MRKQGIQAILQKIRADAQTHAEERYLVIKDEADKEIDGENAFIEDDYAKRRELLANHNAHEYALLLDRLNSRFNRELLTYRHNLIGEIFSEAVRKLIGAPAEDYAEMLLRAVAGLSGDVTLHIGELSADKITPAAIKAAQDANGNLFINVSDALIPNRGGFMLNDSRVEYNCLFDDLMEDKRNEQAAFILNEVFGEMRA
jgi:vacuolar-type H+-ATPase subunit E/Vma4